MFAFLVFVAAFLIEGIGTYVSVIGLSSLFAANPVIIVLAVALDLGKVVTVTFLYKYWGQVNYAMRSYMLTAAMVLMVITSAGCFGYLSGEFQRAIAGTNTHNIELTSITEEQGRLQKRKVEIDTQIAQLPANFVNGRRQLARQFAPELNGINKRLGEIDVKLPALKMESISKNVEVGPIVYIAEAFDTTPEKAVKWVILVIIFVFDPLAISLLLAGNFLLRIRQKEKDDAVVVNRGAMAVADPEPADTSGFSTAANVEPMADLLVDEASKLPEESVPAEAPVFDHPPEEQVLAEEPVEVPVEVPVEEEPLPIPTDPPLERISSDAESHVVISKVSHPSMLEDLNGNFGDVDMGTGLAPVSRSREVGRLTDLYTGDGTGVTVGRIR